MAFYSNDIFCEEKKEGFGLVVLKSKTSITYGEFSFSRYTYNHYGSHRNLIVTFDICHPLLPRGLIGAIAQWMPGRENATA